MSKNGAQDVVEAAKSRFSDDLEALRSSFTDLKTDLTKIIHDAVATGRESAHVVGGRASDAMSGVKDQASALKDKSSETLEALGDKIGENPVASTLVAFGVGFLIAKLLTRH